jgi:UDP-2-acetamido-2,6-beta-L-arabino-hexul-4-ose reductase
LKIGITGQSGFIGTHLYNTLGLYPQKYTSVPFKDEFFRDETSLGSFVKSCDAIVHLAALNRHNDPEHIYKTNIELVRKLIDACLVNDARPHILFSSSTQEELSNTYGKSKKEGRILFENWAKLSGAKFTGLVIPNVFGPFGNPYYNSVVATFCHQLTHNKKPSVIVDSDVNLIYVSQLVSFMLNEIDATNGELVKTIVLPAPYSVKVSALLEKLSAFQSKYFSEGTIPDLNDELDRHLFETMLTYIDHESFFPFSLRMNSDNRGSFVETIKLGSGGQVSFSTTKPGITRGNHFHTRKSERFAVIKGQARIETRRIGTTRKLSFDLDGSHPSFVDMPVWYTHNITNTGMDDLYTIFWINESFNPEDPDTFYENV